MPKKLPIFYSALLLTVVNLLLRLVGTSFQVYLSSRIGAEGIGLLQLVMSVGSMAMVAGMAGIRTATMYLTAEQIGKKRPENVTWVLSGCIAYSVICSAAVGGAVYIFAPQIAKSWIGNPETVSSLRLFAAFLPISCLTGVMVGYFTGANRIGTLAAVEVAEQFCCMVCTIMLLSLWAGHDAARSCQAVVMGSGMGACLTLVSLVVLRVLEHPKQPKRLPVARQLTQTAIPLALADDLRTGISTVENLMVPKRLALYSGSLSPLAAFGTVCGMVFPILTFPMAILFGLTELLIPELARCRAAGSTERINYLVKKSLRVALLYGTLCGGILFLTADDLCLSLYKSKEAGTYLRWFSLLAVMLYCDGVTDAMIKGLGEQKASVRYNILTNTMDVTFLYFLLPKYGIFGYFLSFLVTHVINFCFSLRRLLRITVQRIPLRIPLLTLVAAILALWICHFVTGAVFRAAAYVIILLCLLFLMRILSREDIRWIKGLIYKK
ncbi:MAG: polysaccharide biosynthesis C-terminal domain-containing protein [Oscillospiraceae bacterium]|nr:polysaccharide biosynthesis C-terminal domain-containing protein [Oscillospiraceae bacterium]